MEKNINELGYKNHDPFYYNLNKNFQGLLNQVVVATRDLTTLEELYIMLNSFYLFYSPYMKQKQGVITGALSRVRGVVYSTEFSTFLSTKKTNPEFYQKILDTIDTVNTIIPVMMSELHDNELFPRLKKIDHDTPGAVKYG